MWSPSSILSCAVFCAFVAGVAGVAGCDEPPKPAPPSASASRPDSAAPAPQPEREGCARTGLLDGVENEPSCVVQRASEEAMRAALKQLAITLEPEVAEVVGGGTSLLKLTIKNTSQSEAVLLFEARPRPPGPRPDWSRVVGIPEPHPNAAETPRLHFPMTTTDGYNRDVDQVPVVAGTAVPPPPPPLLAVRLRPGGKLTHVSSWWALRIPAPAPVVTNDAGHRYVPKTTAVNLFPGEYTVTMELPFFGLSREERKVTARMKVTRTPLPDGGFRRLFY